MELDNKSIVSGFAIAADSLDDSAPYSGAGDCFVYYDSRNGEWGSIGSAEITNNEYKLVKMLDAAIRNSKTYETVVRDYKPFPISITTTISTLKSQKFDDYLTQFKREQALKKLSEEDMVVLGLMGEKK